jgi:hypothetical protein
MIISLIWKSKIHQAKFLLGIEFYRIDSIDVYEQWIALKGKS